MEDNKPKPEVKGTEVVEKPASPKGSGKFDDMVLVKATAKHPTRKGQEFKVHSVHIPFLTRKGYIEKLK